VKNIYKTTLITALLFPLISNSAELKVEPVYGVERTQREYPKPARYKTEAFYGVRGLYGVPTFSLELEVNESKSKEDFPDSDLVVNYTNQKALLGFRSYPVHSEYVGVFLRFGARAEKKKRVIVESGVERTEDDPLSFDPYAGTGVTLSFNKLFALNAGATLIYNKNAENESEKYDTRYSFSFTMKLGNK
jgi:hypothetical protein